jgi:Ni/Fe-hydrogenase subunit HybB-like protein
MISRSNSTLIKKPVFIIFALLIVIGLATFLYGLRGQHPERAWQTYLINFLFWSAIAQGGLLFSAVTHLTKARWSQPVQNLAESFVAFFPFSLVLFLFLFLGKEYVFPWLHHDLHGKEAWLNLPFLFTRDLLGLLTLYGLGLAYFYNAMRLKLDPNLAHNRIQSFFLRGWTGSEQDRQKCRQKMTRLSVLYILAYAFVLSVISFDLVMSMEPHWYSTLFAPYSFVKAFYIGMGCLILLAAVVRLAQGEQSMISAAHFHDIGKIFLAFCLLWADFFYVQLMVIWYGNISEETSYVITRVVMLPWKHLAWSVFLVVFLLPFLILLNQKIKTKPIFMIILCSVVGIGIWFEHLLLIGPAMSPGITTLPVGIADGLISLGFLGLMSFAVTYLLKLFPELVPLKEKEVG